MSFLHFCVSKKESQVNFYRMIYSVLFDQNLREFDILTFYVAYFIFETQPDIRIKIPITLTTENLKKLVEIANNENEKQHCKKILKKLETLNALKVIFAHEIYEIDKRGFKKIYKEIPLKT